MDASGLRDTIKKLCNENRESSDHPRKLKLSSENRTVSDERCAYSTSFNEARHRVGNRRFETPLPALVNAFEDADIFTSEAQTKKSIADIGISAPSAKLI